MRKDKTLETGHTKKKIGEVLMFRGSKQKQKNRGTEFRFRESSIRQAMGIGEL